jgi:hypothetical protein
VLTARNRKGQPVESTIVISPRVSRTGQVTGALMLMQERLVDESARDA